MVRRHPEYGASIACLLTVRRAYEYMKECDEGHLLK